MPIEYNGTPFTYNAANNVNADNQLAAILSNFSDDYIMDVVKESIDKRFRIYSQQMPNIVASYELNFKELSEGFTSRISEIAATRQRVYSKIIDIICDYYNLTFNLNKDDNDLYSAAFWLYDFFVSGFTDKAKNFYTSYIIRERYNIDSALGLTQKKENANNYSKQLFNDDTLASIHLNIEEVIKSMATFNITLNTVLYYVYPDPNISSYIGSLVLDQTNNFFNTYYTNIFMQDSNKAADMLINIKLNLQQVGKFIESEK